jgi:hypothetical protein
MPRSRMSTSTPHANLARASFFPAHPFVCPAFHARRWHAREQ